LNNLALMLGATNRLAQAEPLYRRALAIDERSSGRDRPDVAIRACNLAALLRATNRLPEAVPLYRQAVVIDENSYGPVHPSVARHLGKLAELLRVMNRTAEAESLFRRALGVDEILSGPGHPRVTTNLGNLAGLLRATDRLPEAEILYRRVLGIDHNWYGPNHSEVAIDLSILAELLVATNRLSNAEQLVRRALAIDERAFGPDHPKLATDLNNLVSLLRATNRAPQAEPLMARAVCILLRFQRLTGQEHPQTGDFAGRYGRLLAQLKLGEPEISRRIRVAGDGRGRLAPIVPEVERSLGPAMPVAEVLAAMDRQDREKGKPGVLLLKLDEPIAPHLDELLRPSADARNEQGVLAFRTGAHADAVMFYDSALELMANLAAQAPPKLRTRMNRAAALRELGLTTEARNELAGLLPELDRAPAIDAATKGRARYHLALCQWRLGERASAQQAAEASLAAYDAAQKSKPTDPGLRRQSEELLAAVKAGKDPPPLPKIDAPVAIEAARARYRACEALAKLPLNQKATPLLDQVLGPARPTKEVLEALDLDYRKQNKPAVWFLPLNESISPHLDQLLGPAKSVREVLDSLDRQYRAQGKPAVWFLPLDEPIAKHLDELLGKSPG
jgi:tetratricopeptide (TPR) repeat protein